MRCRLYPVEEYLKERDNKGIGKERKERTQYVEGHILECKPFIWLEVLQENIQALHYSLSETSIVERGDGFHLIPDRLRYIQCVNEPADRLPGNLFIGPGEFHQRLIRLRIALPAEYRL